MLAKQIGIDLGTVNVLVWERGRGIIITEPSVVALAVSDSKILAIGDEARAMWGRSPESIEVLRPLRDGVIADFLVTEAMLRYFILKICGPLRLFRPTVMISVPVGVTSVESRAVHDAAVQAGAREALLIPEPLAAAVGARLPIDTPSGNLVLDIGGGTTEAAVISMNGIVASSAVRVGGLKMDEAIGTYIRKKYNLMIGEQTAEEIKIQIGSALPQEPELEMSVRGRDQVTGLPKTINVTSTEVTEALQEPISAIVSTAKAVLERTPPELISDIMDRGLTMTGGGSLLRGLEGLMSLETGITAHLAEEPMACVARGAGQALENYHLLRRHLYAS